MSRLSMQRLPCLACLYRGWLVSLLRKVAGSPGLVESEFVERVNVFLIETGLLLLLFFFFHVRAGPTYA